LDANALSLNGGTITDAAGNAATLTAAAVTDNASYKVDTTAPTVTVSATPTNLLAGQTSLVTFTFSEAVSGVDNADVSVSGGTLSTITATGDPKVYTATFTPNSTNAESGSVTVL